MTSADCALPCLPGRGRGGARGQADQSTQTRRAETAQQRLRAALRRHYGATKPVATGLRVALRSEYHAPRAGNHESQRPARRGAPGVAQTPRAIPYGPEAAAEGQGTSRRTHINLPPLARRGEKRGSLGGSGLTRPPRPEEQLADHNDLRARNNRHRPVGHHDRSLACKNVK